MLMAIFQVCMVRKDPQKISEKIVENIQNCTFYRQNTLPNTQPTAARQSRNWLIINHYRPFTLTNEYFT